MKLNVRSFVSNKSELEAILRKHWLNIVSLQETLLSGCRHKPRSQNYNLFWECRTGKRYGGCVVILIESPSN